MPEPTAPDRPPPDRRARLARNLLLAVLGAWLAASACMAFVATGNFRVVEPSRLRNSAEVFAALPEEDGSRRAALRYVASELNRHFFTRFGVADAGLAVLALLLLAASGGRPRWGVLLLSLLVAWTLADALWITPSLVEQGRAIDFVPRDPPPAEVAAFYRLHTVDVTVELAKMVVLGILLLRIAGGRTR